MIDLVAYLRVSTSRQETSGLGLEAQRRAVHAYAASTCSNLIATFVEVESGAKAARPELGRALTLCRRKKATLLIARLDRLSRSLSFIAQLMDGAVDIRCADMPEANRITLQIMAVFAEHERQIIRERTRAALAAAKQKGIILGTNGAALAGRHKAKADAFALSTEPYIREGMAAGHLSLRSLGRYLTENRVPTSSGGAWHPRTVQHLLKRLQIG